MSIHLLDLGTRTDKIVAPLLSIGLFGFSWTSLGPPQVHWIAPLIFTAVVGIANYAVYKSSIDYMIAAYGPYAASATGGNDLARDFLAGIAALYAHPRKCSSVSVFEDSY